MLIRAIFIALVFTLVDLPIEAGFWDSLKTTFKKETSGKTPRIRILIARDIDSTQLEVKGKYNIIDPYKNTRLGTRFMGKSNVIQPLAGGLKWGEEFPGVYQIAIIPDLREITTVVDGVEYRGNIYVYDIGGTISIVNEVDIEDYLNSMLSLEYGDKLLDPEAMAAVAIVQRTDALYKARNAPNPYWHVDGEKVHYLGQGIAHRSKRVDDALTSTRYMVLSARGLYEGDVIPLEISKSGFTVEKAISEAEKGENASKMLSKIFPDSVLRMTNQSQ